MRLFCACLTALVAWLAADLAGAACTCRAKGVVASEGQTLCIRTPQGPRLARCDKVSNITSWTFLSGPCPQAALDPDRSRAAHPSSKARSPL